MAIGYGPPGSQVHPPREPHGEDAEREAAQRYARRRRTRLICLGVAVALIVALVLVQLVFHVF